MATSTFQVLDKKRLDHNTMHETRVRIVADLNQNSFTWIIHNFHSLKNNEQYCTFAIQTAWIFAITKIDCFYDIAIDTIKSAYCGEMTLLISYDRNVYSEPIPVTRTPNFVYQVRIPIKIVHTKENLFLSFDSAAFEFKWHKCINLIKVIELKPSKEPRRHQNIKRDFRKILSLHHPDFLIRGTDNYFFAHKSILSARSSYFRQYIRENCSDDKPGEMDVNLTEDEMHYLLSFIYTGDIPFPLTAYEWKYINMVLKSYGITKIGYGPGIYISKDTQFL